LEEAEARAELSSTHAASLLSRERQLLQECRALQREVDKLRLELAKVATRFANKSVIALQLLVCYIIATQLLYTIHCLIEHLPD